MKRTAIVSMILLGTLVAPLFASSLKHTISVVGKAEEKVKPDVAYLRLYIQTQNVLISDAVQDAEKQVENVIAAIKTETNIIRTITVTDLSLGEEKTRYWQPDQEKTSPRPEVTKSIFITCDPDPKAICELIDKAIAAGALIQISTLVNYSGDIRSVVMYGVEQSEKVVDRLEKAAIADAKLQAQKLAALIDKKVGSVVSLQQIDSKTYWRVIRVMGQKMDYPAEYVSISPDQITISRTINVSYELTR